MQSLRKGVVIILMLELGSARHDNEDPKIWHLGWVS